MERGRCKISSKLSKSGRNRCRHAPSRSRNGRGRRSGNSSAPLIRGLHLPRTNSSIRGGTSPCRRCSALARYFRRAFVDSRPRATAEKEPGPHRQSPRTGIVDWGFRHGSAGIQVAHKPAIAWGYFRWSGGVRCLGRTRDNILLELLRPPAGCKLDVAVGTTYSLDLISALMLPLSFAFFDWEHEDGELVADPLALLEALRRYGDRFTIFCQSGQIRLPSKYPPLVTFLEPCIYDVVAPDEDGVFHPKVWALRFIAEDGVIRYRVLCLSRNLTFDRCWDTVVALDGELTDRSNAIAVKSSSGRSDSGAARSRPAPAAASSVVRGWRRLRTNCGACGSYGLKASMKTNAAFGSPDWMDEPLRLSERGRTRH